jgi:hypothetical protein
MSAWKNTFIVLGCSALLATCIALLLGRDVKIRIGGEGMGIHLETRSSVGEKPPPDIRSARDE